jgi:hypothetical protein
MGSPRSSPLAAAVPTLQLIKQEREWHSLPLQRQAKVSICFGRRDPDSLPPSIHTRHVRRIFEEMWQLQHERNHKKYVD